MYRGHEGVADVHATTSSSSGSDSRIEVERAASTLGDTVVVVTQYQRGKGSERHRGRGPLLLLFTFRDGKIVRIELFSTETEALEAAGLSE